MKPQINKYWFLFGFCVLLFIFSFSGVSISSIGNSDLRFGYADTAVQECGCSKCHKIELDGCGGCHDSGKSQDKSIDTQVNSLESYESDNYGDVNDNSSNEPESKGQSSPNSKADNQGSETKKSPRR